ncbi:MAG: ATPase [Gammaproteobacteria bacterium RIFCSPHIGHO2_12_FULL_42_10]|nr:MAG: ATPase [Gammaproteobacteria bacterium RIFCSPHIGHO2_12_FULL_42_10]
MKRIIQSDIQKDLPSKIVLLTGPRQCGKTTLSKQLYESYDYFNYDSAEDRLALIKKSWDRNKKLLILDELHKMNGWKRWLKGIYDTEGIPPEILVTGSARLDVSRKMGDSLAGRYFQFRLHPLDLKEISQHDKRDINQLFNQLWHCSGFPEPFFKNDVTYYKRWRRTHLDIILRQDLLDIYTGHDIQTIETLVLLLKERVGSTVSYASLARDLERDPNTIKRWLQLLENLYIIFRVTPFHKNIARSLLKEPKYYFYDHAYVDEDKGARLENLVACALLKELQLIEDTQGIRTNLHYLRTKEGKELDFLIFQENKPSHLIEIKWSDDAPGRGFGYFSELLPQAKKIQLVKEIKREKTYPDGLEIRALIPWLAKFSITV